MTIKAKNPESVAKCACGKVMRYKDWGSHSTICRRGSVQVLSEDVDKMLREEAQAKRSVEVKPASEGSLPCPT